jgi:hypothetical protein
MRAVTLAHFFLKSADGLGIQADHCLNMVFPYNRVEMFGAHLAAAIENSGTNDLKIFGQVMEAIETQGEID